MDPCDADNDRFDPPVEWTQQLLLELAHKRKREGLLVSIVQRVSELPDLALAREGGVEIGDYPNVLRWFARLRAIVGFECAPVYSAEPLISA
jgi:hypothetical protein